MPVCFHSKSEKSERILQFVPGIHNIDSYAHTCTDTNLSKYVGAKNKMSPISYISTHSFQSLQACSQSGNQIGNDFWNGF